MRHNYWLLYHCFSISHWIDPVHRSYYSINCPGVEQFRIGVFILNAVFFWLSCGFMLRGYSSFVLPFSWIPLFHFGGIEDAYFTRNRRLRILYSCYTLIVLLVLFSGFFFGWIDFEDYIIGKGKYGISLKNRSFGFLVNVIFVNIRVSYRTWRHPDQFIMIKSTFISVRMEESALENQQKASMLTYWRRHLFN